MELSEYMNEQASRVHELEELVEKYEGGKAGEATDNQPDEHSQQEALKSQLLESDCQFQELRRVTVEKDLEISRLQASHQPEQDLLGQGTTAKELFKLSEVVQSQAANIGKLKRDIQEYEEKMESQEGDNNEIRNLYQSVSAEHLQLQSEMDTIRN